MENNILRRCHCTKSIQRRYHYTHNHIEPDWLICNNPQVYAIPAKDVEKLLEPLYEAIALI